MQKKLRNIFPTFDEVPEVVIERLPIYIRILTSLQNQGNIIVSSKTLGESLQISAAKIRRDLNYFGRFGKQGHGYKIKELRQTLITILGLDGTWNVALIGLGRLGKAIASYPGFPKEGFRIVALFDTNKSLLGTKIGRISIQPLEELRRSVKTRNIKIAIIATPSMQTQNVVNKLVDSNVKCILNYAHSSPKVPPDIIIKPIDPILTLQAMAFHLRKEHIKTNNY